MGSPLLIIGSVAIDTIKTPAGVASDQLGGSAVFAALAARHWANPIILSAIGADFPAELLAKFDSSKLNTSHLTKAAGASFRWTGIYDEHLGTRHALDFNLGVMSTAKLEHGPMLSKAQFVVMATYDPSRQMELIPYLHKKAFVATDTIIGYITHTNHRAALTELYKNTNLVTLNDEELYAYTSTKDQSKAAAHVLNIGPQYLVVKHGEKGSSLYTREGKILEVGAVTTTAKDTTGAGDSYLGVLMAVLSHHGKVNEKTLLEGMRLGSAAASITVEAFGVDSIILATKTEIEKRAKGL